MTINFENPLDTLIEVIRKEWPELECEILFAARESEGGGPIPDGALGCTAIDLKPPRVFVWAGCPIQGALDIIAHEVAHVLVGDGESDHHGPLWEQTYRYINELYCKEVDVQTREWNEHERDRLDLN